MNSEVIRNQHISDLVSRAIEQLEYDGREDLAEAIKTLRTILEDLIPLAAAAMTEANADGGEYDINDELAEARAALEAARKGGTG